MKTKAFMVVLLFAVFGLNRAYGMPSNPNFSKTTVLENLSCQNAKTLSAKLKTKRPDWKQKIFKNGGIGKLAIGLFASGLIVGMFAGLIFSGAISAILINIAIAAICLALPVSIFGVIIGGKNRRLSWSVLAVFLIASPFILIAFLYAD